MNKLSDLKLEKILNDKTSGSSEILLSLNKYFLSICNNTRKLKYAVSESQKKLKHFAVTDSYLSKMKKYVERGDVDSINDFLFRFENAENRKYQIIFEKILRKLPAANNIITLSKSGTLIKVFKLWHRENKNLNVIIMESRPGNEGRLMAKELLRAGLKVQLITDAMMSLYVPEIDAAIVGADIILKNKNVVNKTGSKALAVLCKYYKKPFYVLATKSKFVNRSKYKLKEDECNNIWDYKHPNLKIKNFPFEEIEKKFITSIITE
ncbi:methylthioribose-1-phosphate isomerase [bacterium BMS3Abin03]|nr:methylthioribose-1-phosphate isomerase [bacterium BMS3Abin03]